MHMINIYYHRNNIQFDGLSHLNQEYCALEDITQCAQYSKHTFNIVNNGEKHRLDKTAPVLIPIDYQSIQLASENRDAIETVFPLGEQVEKFVDEVAEYLRDYNIVFLLYTSTEPYFNDNLLFLNRLVKRHSSSMFIISGSGTKPVRYQHHYDELFANSNIKFVSKSWYIDKVHYNKFVLPDGENRHFCELDDTAPDNIPEYMTCPNRFLLTMRNPRAHRLIMSTLIENSGKDRVVLDATRYGRAWCHQSWMFDQLFNNPDTASEAQYQLQLLTTALKDVLDQNIADGFIARMMHTLYTPPHKLDMPDISDKGFTPKWLYNNVNLAVIASGEGDGYGYIDEKHIIPIYYKKPFISFGSKGVNEELKKIGFDAYESVFDQTYASKDLMYERVYGCYSLLKDIAMYSLDKSHEVFTVKGAEVANHNFENFVSCNFRHLGNNAFFEELLDACN